MKTEEEFIEELRALKKSKRYVVDDTVYNSEEPEKCDEVAFNKGIKDYTIWLKHAFSENT